MYNIGDTVRIKEDLQNGEKYGGITYLSGMPKGLYTRIENVYQGSECDVYTLAGAGHFKYSGEMIENAPTSSIEEDVKRTLESGEGGGIHSHGVSEEDIDPTQAEEYEEKSKEQEEEQLLAEVNEEFEESQKESEGSEQSEGKEEENETTKKKKGRKKKGEQQKEESEDEKPQEPQEPQEEEKKEEYGIVNNEKELHIIDTAIKANIPLLLVGETGTGKTTLVRHLASKSSKELVRINLNGQTGREELIGKYVLIGGETVWQDGPLVTGLKKGHWILLDEINAALPEVLFVIQALAESTNGNLGHILLAEKDGEIVVPHKEARLFGTANPSDKYVGTKDFNPATLSRFLMLTIDVLSQEKERQLIAKKLPQMKAEDIFKITEIGFALRKLYEKEDITYFCSTRDLVYMAELMVRGLTLEDTFDVVIFNKIQTKLEQERVVSAVRSTINMSSSKVKETISELEKAKQMIKDVKEQQKEFESIKSDALLLFEDNKRLKQEIEQYKERNAKLEELKKLLM